MERLNEIDYAHQLEILDKRLVVLHKADTIETREWVRRPWHKKRAKMPKILWRPSSLSLFTIRQLNYILLSIQRDYLATTHSFTFDGEHYLIKIINDEDPHTDQPKTVLPEMPEHY